jgi:putative ABC transport system permease protein
MYIIKNALKSISRSKGRNILIGIIIMVIAVSSCIALSIRNSANEIVSAQKESFAITATVGIDREAMRTNSQSGGTDLKTLMESIPALTVDQLKNYADSTYVKSLNYSVTTSMDSSNITAVSNSASTTATTTAAAAASKTAASASTSGNSNGTMGGPGGDMNAQSAGDFRVTGYSSTAAMTSFISGTSKITSGAMFSGSDTSNVCVISDELASANSLAVNSTITLTNPNDTTQSYTYKVVGIYTDTSTSEGSQMNMFSDSANRIITNYTAANNMITASASNSTTKLSSQLNSSFSLANAESLDAFKSELTAKGLNKYYTVTSNISSFNQSVEPLSNLSNFATIFLLLVLAIGGIILVVLNLINIRERKYEIGVLRAIGMKKGKVALQFITELSLVTIIALFIGSGIGAAASVPTANYMLKTEIASIQTQSEQQQQNFGMQASTSGQSTQKGGMGGFFGTAANVSYVNQINAVINGMVLLEMLGIGIILVILSSGMSLIFISRYEPLKILSSRS